MTGAGSTVSYQYSPEGYRTGKIANGVFTNYGYDTSGRLMWTNFGTGTPDEVYFNGRHFGYMYVNADESLNHFVYSSVDWLGSEMARTDASKKVLARFYHLPFGDGQTLIYGSDDGDPLHFTGKERDAESGNDYFGARHYNSSLGRFMTADPYSGSMDITNPQSLNRYSYTLNNPLRFTDPFGLDCIYTTAIPSTLQITDVTDPSTGLSSEAAIKTGDCLSENDNGIFVNGTVNASSLTYNSSTGSTPRYRTIFNVSCSDPYDPFYA